MPEEGAEGAHVVGDAAAALDDFLIGGFGVHVPLPGVFEGHDLGAGAGAVFFGEGDVVVLAAVEWRVAVGMGGRIALFIISVDCQVVAPSCSIFLLLPPLFSLI